MLTLGWSDGSSFLPLDFILCSSAKEEKRVQGIKKALDKRTCGYKRRMEAITKSTEHLDTMVKRALALGVKASYILMDIWFCWPTLLARLGAHLPVICMGKKMPKVFYHHQDQWLTLGKVYTKIRKRPGKARILASVVVETKLQQMVKVVFVRHLFFACSDEIKDLSLLEALQRLLALALDKVRSSGEFAESVVIAMIDAIMGAAIEFIQTSRRLAVSTDAYSTT